MLKRYTLYEVVETNNMFQLIYCCEIQAHNIVEAEYELEKQMDSGKDHQIIVSKL